MTKDDARKLQAAAKFFDDRLSAAQGAFRFISRAAQAYEDPDRNDLRCIARLCALGLTGEARETDSRALIAAREYRYLPPVFRHDKAGRIGRLKGAGLVHTPNLHLKALAAEKPPMPMNIPATPDTAKAPDPAAMPARIIAVPGLPPGADAQDLISALKKALKKAVEKALEKALADPDPKRFVPVAAVQDMLRDRNARLATLSEAAAGSKVDDALRRGYLTPGLRNWALSLCRQDPDSFDGFLSGAVPAFGHLTKACCPPPVRARPAVPQERPTSRRFVLDRACRPVRLPHRGRGRCQAGRAAPSPSHGTARPAASASLLGGGRGPI